MVRYISDNMLPGYFDDVCSSINYGPIWIGRLRSNRNRP